MRLEAVATPPVVNREIADALAANDVDLANSFIDLARDRSIPVEPTLATKVESENSGAATAKRNAAHFVRGFFKGEPDDAASLAGTAIGDLLLVGDVRDAVREGKRLYDGERADELVLGLACLGIAVTAGTYATWGAAAPARAAVTLVKAARKTGRISAPLGVAVGRAVSETVDTAAFRRAVTSVSLRDPAVAFRAARDAVKVERTSEISRMIGDVGRVQARAGTAATLDGVRLAQGGARPVALGQARGEGGQQDPRHPQTARRRRHCRVDADLRGFVVAADRTPCSVRVLLRRQRHRGTRDLALPALAETATQADLGIGGSRGISAGSFTPTNSSTMPSFNNGPVEIAYLDTGEGDPIVLVHGFGSNKEINWVNPGWVTTLTGDGRRVIALDNRGHGASTKLYDPADYQTARPWPRMCAPCSIISISSAPT